jgi:hypothetical protein
MMGKFRNKKTGEIKEWDYVCALTESNPGEIYDSDEYDSIAKLCENWEDYEPVEPLIKDEKIRKAVRAWAEASSIDTTEIKVSKGIVYTAIIGWKDCRRLSMDFESYMLEKLEDGKTYTITELCGEEEE